MLKTSLCFQTVVQSFSNIMHGFLLYSFLGVYILFFGYEVESLAFVKERVEDFCTPIRLLYHVMQSNIAFLTTTPVVIMLLSFVGIRQWPNSGQSTNERGAKEG